jgi:hypothetical protein
LKKSYCLHPITSQQHHQLGTKLHHMNLFGGHFMSKPQHKVPVVLTRSYPSPIQASLTQASENRGDEALLDLQGRWLRSLEKLTLLLWEDIIIEEIIHEPGKNGFHAREDLRVSLGQWASGSPPWEDDASPKSEK